MRTPPSHAHAGLVFVIKGLMYPRVQDQSINPCSKRFNGGGLQECGIFGILTGFRPACKCLSTNNGFAGSPRCWRYLCLNTSPMCPKFSHGNIGKCRAFNYIKRTPIRLELELQPQLLHHLFSLVPAIFKKQPVDNIIEVPFETGSLFFTVDHRKLAKLILFKNRQPGHGIISFSLDELIPKCGCPILKISFITINQQVFEGTPKIVPNMLFQRIQYSLPMKRILLGTHLIHFQSFTDDVIRKRMWISHGWCMTIAVDGPFPRRWSPFKLTITIHFVGYIYDVGC